MARYAVALLLLSTPAFAHDLRVTSLSKQFFTPALGEKVSVSVEVPQSGALTVRVLDRDGYGIR